MHVCVQMATGRSATSLLQDVPPAQSKRERALDFARQIPRPSVQQQHIDDSYAMDKPEESQQTQLQHLEQQYLADQQRLASILQS